MSTLNVALSAAHLIKKYYNISNLLSRLTIVLLWAEKSNTLRIKNGFRAVLKVVTKSGKIW